MTADDLKAARDLVDAAIVAPWSVEEHHSRPNGPDECTVLDGNGFWVAEVGADPKSAAFIAASRTLVPRLLDEVTRLTQDNADCRATLTEVTEQLAAIRERSLLTSKSFMGDVDRLQRQLAKAEQERDEARLSLAGIEGERDGYRYTALGWQKRATTAEAERDRMKPLYDACIAVDRTTCTCGGEAGCEDTCPLGIASKAMWDAMARAALEAP